MVTSIEVIDTAIKIGLGALISGFAALLIAKLNHDKTVEKERALRRRELLETVAEQVSAYSQAALNLWAFVVGSLGFAETREQTAETDREAFNKYESELFISSKEVTSAQAKLLLLGEVKCARMLRQFTSHVRSFSAESVTERELTEDELRAYKVELTIKHDAFFTELSNIYKKL